MRRLGSASFHPDPAVDSIPQLRRRRDVPWVVLSVIFLVIGTVLWDETAFHLTPVSGSYWAGMMVSASLCLLCFSMCRRGWPLLLCIITLVSIRIVFAFTGSMPDDGTRLALDCFAVCVSLSTMVFQAEIVGVSHWVRRRLDENPTRTRRAQAVAGLPIAAGSLATLSHARPVPGTPCTVDS
ncbi:MAG TPA: hypothetical protein VGM02_17655 [Acidobacteriaceae bacterium]|jgi:hypothetical protein